MTYKYPIAPMEKRRVADLGMNVYHGYVLAGADDDETVGAVFSDRLDSASKLASQAFGGDLQHDGAQRSVLIDEGKFAELLRLAGLSESE